MSIDTPLAELPVLDLTAEDEAAGRIAALQAAAGTSVVHGRIPTGPASGPAAFLVGPDALEYAYGAGRDALGSHAGWLPLMGRRFGAAVINADEPRHMAERRAWATAFTPAVLAAWLPALSGLVDAHVARWCAAGRIDAYAAARALSFQTITDVVAGLPAAALDGVAEAFWQVTDGPHDGESTAAYHARVAPVRDRLEARMLDALQAFVRTPQADRGVLHAVVRAQPSLTAEALLPHLNILLIAGHETTAALMAWMLLLLSQHGDVARQVAHEAAGEHGPPTLDALERAPALDALVTETARLHAPLVNAPRVATRAFTFDGVHVPADTRVALAIGATLRSARSFTQPDRFLPGRFAADGDARMRADALRAFACGARLCLGMRLARLEAKLLARAVVQHSTLVRDGTARAVHAGFWNGRPRGDLRIGVEAR